MASEEKIREFLEKSEIIKTTSSLKDMVFSRMYLELMKDGDENAGEYCEFEKRKSDFLTQKTVNFMAKFFENNFTDEEIDELIAIHSSPTYKRLTESLPSLMTNLFDYMEEHEKEVEEEIRSIQAQVKEEYKALAGATGETMH